MAHRLSGSQEELSQRPPAPPTSSRSQPGRSRFARRSRSCGKLLVSLGSDIRPALGIPKMGAVTSEEERDGFPTVGSRARMFKRFERDLRRWLETPEGRFAAWHAEQTVAEPQPAPADR